VKAHDPVAMERFQQEHGDLDVTICADVESALRDCDAAVLVTEWPQYRELDWEGLARSMRTAIMLDGRLVLDRARLTRAGFRYVGI